MKYLFWGTLAMALFFSASAARCQVPARPFPQHTTYASGTIRPNHVSQEELDSDTRNFYDLWKSRYLIGAGQEPDGQPRYRVEHGGGNTVSEGQGYGMLLAVYLAGHDPDARLIFDGLWEFALDHPSMHDSRLMDWYVNGDESPDTVGDDSAFDGDSDMAFALLLAERQWGNDGRFNYRTEATRVLAGMLQSTVGPDSRLPLLGDWIIPYDEDFNQWTARTSDLMPDHFRNFALATNDMAWAEVLDACQSLVEQMQNDFSPTAGLLPDFILSQQPASPPYQPVGPNYLEGPDDGRYDYNACRDPWRLATHALITGDGISLNQVRRITQWLHTATGGDPLAVRAGYNLDGTVQTDADYFTTAFAAPFAVACMTDPAEQDLLNGLYDAIRLSDEDYYEDTLTALCLVVLSGNWWAPLDEVTTVDPELTAGIQVFLPHPNPLNPQTEISFSLARATALKLRIFDSRGRLVRSLLEGSFGPGRMAVEWDGRDDQGRALAAGVYLVRLAHGSGFVSCKVSLVK